MVSWSDTGTLSGINLDSAGLGLSTSWCFEKSNVEVKFNETTGSVAAIRLYTRPAGGGTVRNHRDLTLIKPGTMQKAGYGQAMRLTKATSYDLAVEIEDGGGLIATRVALAQTTRSDPSSPATLLATVNRYVAETGNDTTGTGLIGAPWRTLDKARASAPVSAIVRIAPGFYPPSAAARTGALTIVGQNPPCDSSELVDGGPQSINAGTRAIFCHWRDDPTTAVGGVDPGVIGATAPSSETDTRFQVAASEWSSYTSPAGNQVWRWTAPLGSGVVVTVMGFSATKTGTPTRLCHIKQAAGIDTIDEFADMINNNGSYRAGYTWNTAAGQIWLKMPANARKADGSLTTDPKDLYMWAGRPDKDTSGGLIQANSADFRVCGIEGRVSHSLVYSTTAANNLIVDHCETAVMFAHLRPTASFGASSAVATTYADTALAEFNRFTDSTLITFDNTTDPGIPWSFIKGNILNATGTAAWTGTGNRMGEQNECAALWSRGGIKNLTFRNNLVDGTFNGISGTQDKCDRYGSYGYEIYGNLFRNLADDTYEPEGTVTSGRLTCSGIINWEIHENLAHDVLTLFSAAPAFYGPIEYWGNVGYQHGEQYIVSVGISGAAGASASGNVPSSNGFKGKGEAAVDGINLMAPIYFTNNTHWSTHIDSPDRTGRTVDGFSPTDGGTGTYYSRLILRNNIIQGTRYAAEFMASFLDEDYNYFATTGAAGSQRINVNSSNKTTMALYRAAAPGNGVHSNDGLAGGGLSSTTIDVLPHTPVNQFAGDPTAGYRAMALASGSVFRAAGIAVPGLFDVASTHFGGVAPDLGAVQFGITETPSLPDAPSGLVATAVSDSEIDLTWTDNADDETSYVVERSLDGLTGWTNIATLAADTESYEDTGLPGLSTRFYRVGAVGGAGTSYSGVASDTTDPSSAVPTAPTGLFALPLSSSSIGLTWTDNASDETSYRVERSANGTSGWSTRATLGINANAYTDVGLNSSETWHYRIIAVNPQGDSAPSSVASATTLPPSPPSAGGRSTALRTTAVRTTAVRTTR